MTRLIRTLSVLLAVGAIGGTTVATPYASAAHHKKHHRKHSSHKTCSPAHPDGDRDGADTTCSDDHDGATV